ncbi:AAA family ATPase [Flavobacterium sediminis]|uniref:AAA family ATPase n=1 Tax=Flavobacterium sediminis TaxID=2201181 RepID=A0A2U8QUP8_9FLAO|nr:AAA family ATPase [Flavobacterium sediminis]AWM13898.1 AAA family ATPase [Flavobacterium sediminis]
MQLKKAKRQQVKLKIGLSGPSGYGKTYSALLLAFGMTNDWNKIAIIDTENNSASLYSHLGEFNVLTLNEPFTPERYIEAIKVCENEGIEVLIIDSISHEWNGKGGCLEIHEQLGGRFQDWNKVTPRHNSFLDAIIQSKLHVITTSRRKVDYSLDQDSNGKTKVMKLGTKEIQREGYEYEITVNFEFLNDKHLVTVSKDRTGLFVGKPEFIINASTGKKLLDWCNQGTSFEELKVMIESTTSTDELKNIYNENTQFKTELYPLIIKRNEELNSINSQVVNDNIVQP